MTRIADRKTRMRAATSASVRNRTLLVELEPWAVTIREAGRRKGFTVTWTSIYTLGATQEANRRRAERAEARKAKRGAK